MKIDLQTKAVAMLLFMFIQILNLNAQGNSCATATAIPTNAFNIPAPANGNPGNEVFFKVSVYAQVDYEITVNATPNTGNLIIRRYDGNCSVLTAGVMPGTPSIGSTIQLSTDDLDFSNGCPELIFSISAPTSASTGYNNASITVSSSTPTNYICPTRNNISLSFNGNAAPDTICSGIGNQTITVSATDNNGNNICLNNGTFSGSGVTDNGGNTATYDPTVDTESRQEVRYSYICPNGSLVVFSHYVIVEDTPTVDMEDQKLTCVSKTGVYNLTGLLTSNSSQEGTWEFVSGPGGASNMIDGSNYNYSEEGCYEFRFTASDQYECLDPDPTGTAFLWITTVPEVSITLDYNGGCLATGSQQVNATVQKDGDGAESWMVNGATATMPYTINAPNTGEAASYQFCYTLEKDNSPTSCSGIQMDTICSTTVCKTVSVYNDGLDCQSNCDPNEVSVCELETSPTFKIECSTIGLSIALPGEIVTAVLTPESKLIQCNDEMVCVNYDTEFLGFSPGSGAGGGKKIEDYPGISVICSVLNFKVLGWRPLGKLYNILQCGKTFAQIILEGISKLAGGEPGVILIADTDGDGAFDYEAPIDDSGFPPIPGESCVPVNTGSQGVITIRYVVGWVNAPAGFCGDAQPDGKNLLDLLPIGAIPIVGPIIEDVLAAAGCNIPLTWTSEKTVQYRVINAEEPVFINCPEDGYTFSQDYSCDTEANWSIPIAIDGCTSEILVFSTDTEETPGVRRISGPAPGDDLEVGTYEVVYEATSCNGKTTQCAIPITINAGDPELQAPNDLVLDTDNDACDRVVLGLAPLKGIGCNTVITYATTGATVLTGNGDISGQTFNIGVTTVTYTMAYDDDGDANTPVVQVTDSFTVTVEDNQLPVAECRDVVVQLDNTGNLTVSASDFNALSSDNCTTAENLDIMISQGDEYSETLTFNCLASRNENITLRVIDEAGNASYCSATLKVIDYFEDFQLAMDVPELCLEAVNPEQLDFTNYLTITRPNGNVIQHENLPILGGSVKGFFGISAYIPLDGNLAATVGTSPTSPGDIGYINPDTGEYTPGTGTGYVTISYLLTIDDQIAQGEYSLKGCFKLVQETFELKQPLDMESPECECLDVNFRAVDLKTVTGGQEPYRIEYIGGTLDLNRDGTPEDTDGIYTYDAENNHSITDETEDLGRLLLNYTSPTWSITVIDSRGCEIFRSGSCDNPDEQSPPEIDCQGVNDFDSEVFICERQYTWTHAIPYDNCAVTQYSYQITNPDGTIAGPFELDALIDDADNGIPISELQKAEYEFQVGTSEVCYYAEDAVGQIATCCFFVSVEDNDPPYFINCPAPDVVVSTETGYCDAYVNFALPLAEDNCGFPTVTQVDDTGLTSGSRFPIGTTILTFKAEDAVGNKTMCKVKVIVNDDPSEPKLTCPQSIKTTNDLWECSAVVNNINALGEDLCSDHLIKTYQIEHEGEVIQSGIDDASGYNFPKGVSTVTYKLTNQPMLRISEVSQDADHLLGGMNPPPIENVFQVASNPILALGNGDQGEGLAYHTEDMRFYHSSGASDGNEYLEEIYMTPSLCVQPNNVTGNTYSPEAMGEITGIVFHEELGKFVVMDVNRGVFVLTDTGDSSPSSTYAGANPLHGFAYIDGVIYGVDPVDNTLVVFDYENGSIVSSVGINISGVQSVTMNPVDDQLYVIYDSGTGTSTLGTVDPSNGMVTEIGDTKVDFASIAFDKDGLLHGVSSDDAITPSTLFTIIPQLPGDDYIEITNFGAQEYDISCLVIKRTLPSLDEETFIVPEGTSLVPGDVFVLHYGPGVDDREGPNYFYNYNLATDLELNDVVTYSISYNDVSIDEVNMIPNSNGGLIRTNIFDTDTPEDFKIADDCEDITLRVYNPDYPEALNNNTSTSLQSIEPEVRTCSFTVEVLDAEAPICMEVDSAQSQNFTGEGFSAVEGECNESVINVPDSEECILANLKVNVQGSIVGAEHITMTLYNPKGETLVLYDKGCSGDASDVNVTFDDYAENTYAAICGDWNMEIRPQGPMMMKYFSDKLKGNWTLRVDVEDGFGASFDVSEWSIDVDCIVPWQMDDVVIPNEVDKCGSEYSWIHPYFADNCQIGTISVDYYSEDEELVVPNSGLLTDNFGKGGFWNTEYFHVGVTVVEYTLVDEVGNKSQCSFTVTVEDEQDPVITYCPNDIYVTMDGGECTVAVDYHVDAEDNCEVTSIIGTPPPGTYFEIGTTPVVVEVKDEAGNTVYCEFNVIVSEHEPETNNLTCNGEINLSLDYDCQAILTADMILEGSDYRCYEKYCIEIKDSSGVVHSNLFGIPDVGQQFEVSITDCLGSGNTCWGVVNIEEKLFPEIQCPADTIISCNVDPLAVDSTGRLLTGELIQLTCEPAASITYKDVIVDNGICGEPRAQILRNWTLIDESGNEVSCLQTITIAPFENSLITWPNDFVYEQSFSCADVQQDQSLTEPDNTGFPKLNGGSVFGQQFCDNNVGYWDEVLQDGNCPSAYEILRHWIVRNECLPYIEGINPVRHVQLIKVDDRKDPELYVIDTIRVSTDTWSCFGEVELPELVKQDNCSEVGVEWFINYGLIEDNYATNLLKGYTTISAIAEDECGNEVQTSFVIEVSDQVPPVAVSEKYISVSLSTDGLAELYAESFDDGSYDNCSDVRFAVKRMDNGSLCDVRDLLPPAGNDNAQFNDIVHFCCSDVGDTTLVQFRVCDDANDNNVYDDSDGDNCVVNMVNVIVGNKLLPVIECPEDKEILCSEVAGIDWEDHDLLDDLFGKINYGGNCYANLERKVSQQMDCPDPSSGILGFVVRSFTVDGAGGTANCSQKITIIGDNTTKLTCDKISLDLEAPIFVESGILNQDLRQFGFDDPTELDPYTGFDSHWCAYNGYESSLDPKDGNLPIQDLIPSFTINCNDSLTYPDVLVNINGVCTEIGTQITVADTFNFGGGACKKYLVHYEVIDNCVFDENFTNPTTGEIDPYHSENGYFELYIEINAFDSDGPTILCEDVELISDNCDGYSGGIQIEATDNCTDPEFFSYQWRIDIDANNSIDYPLSGWFDGSEVNATKMGLNVLPIGKHAVNWLISDGCGNASSCTQIITVNKEDKAPTPKCFDGISTAVMPSAGSIVVLASEFDAGSFDNCTGSIRLTLIPESVALQSSNPFNDSKEEWTFTCDDLTTNGIFEYFDIRVYVEDVNGNFDYCTTKLRIDDTENVCDDQGSIVEISGKIETESSSSVYDATVKLNASNPEFPVTTSTDEEGLYSFTAPQFYDYNIQPSLDENYLNGITTLDIVMIQKHILGISPLTSSYQLIAADVNNDCKVTGTDIIQLRKLILGLYENDDLPNSESWRFVDKSHTFDNSGSIPCDFPESINIGNLDMDASDNDFIGIKVGDVNLSNTSNILNPNVESRTSKELGFILETVKEVEDGVIVAVKSEGYTDIYGWQFALEFPADLARIEAVEPGALSIKPANVGKHLFDKGGLLMSYNSQISESFEREEILFFIKFNTKASDKVLDYIRLNNSFRKAEGYRGEQLEIANIRLSKEVSNSGSFALYQNEPNPFVDRTEVVFELPKSGKASLMFYDATGKIYKHINKDFSQGIHKLILNRDDFANSGVIYYTLKTDLYEETRSMIVLEK